MPKTIDWIVIEQDYIQGDLTYKQLATKHGVGISSIESKASTGEWTDKRKAYRFARESLAVPTEVVATEITLNQGQIDPREVLNFAIQKYYQALPNLEPRSLERSTDAICRLLELQRKLYPPTPAEWAEYAIAEFKMCPVQLWKEVKSQWEQNS